MPNENSSTLDWALYYQKLGLNIIPIKPKTKGEAFFGWNERKNKLPTEKEIKEWWTKWPNANIGLINGKTSGIFLFDIDKKHDRSPSEFNLSPTACTKTGGGGNHFFYKYPNDMDIGDHIGTIFGAGVDIRGIGLAILPPSLHESGNKYAWVVPPDEKFNDAPIWMLEKIKNHQKGGLDTKRNWKDGLEGTSEYRNDTGTSIAGLLFSNLPKKAHVYIPYFLSGWNSNLPNPLPAKEINTICESVSKYVKEEVVSHFKPINFKDFCLMKFPEIQWRVENLIPKQGLTVLASPSGIAKTWLALALSHSIVRGLDFLEQENFKSRQGKVLYLDAEMGLREIQRRCFQLGYKELENPENFHILNSYDFNLNSEESIDILEKYIKEKEIDVLIVDTFRPFSGGVDEIVAKEVRVFFQRFYKLRDAGLSIIFLDHTRKKAPMESKRPTKEKLLGSQDKMASVDVGIMLCEDKKNNIVEVHQVKNRFIPEISPFGFKMVDTSFEDDSKKTTLEFTALKNEDENKIEIAKETIIELLQENSTMTRKDINNALKEQKIGESNADKARRELVDEKLICERQSGRQKEYFMDEEKKEILSNLPEDF